MIIPPIVCLSTIDWDDVWQRHQIFASAFAAQGSQILFVENLGGRAPGVKDVTRVWRRVVNLFKQSIGGLRKVNGVTILSPALLPWTWARAINQIIFLPVLARQIRKLGFSNSTVWTYSPSSNAMRLIELLKPDYVVYDCVADIKGYTYSTPEMIVSESNLVQRADLVLTDAQTLYIDKKSLNANTHRVPPGVNSAQFEPKAHWVEPVDLAGLRHPRLGFFGTLGWWVDFELLRDFALTHPDWEIVLIGPVKTDNLSAIKDLGNVNLLGRKSHAELSDYLQGMDVLCIPYVVDAFTRGVLPAKLYESLATGKPIVSTAIDEMTSYVDYVSVTDRSRFAKTVEEAFQGDTLAKRESRVRLARDNSWDVRLAMIAELFPFTINKITGGTKT